MLSDPNNATEYGGAPVVDPVSGAITYVHTKFVFGSHGCGGCVQWGTRSVDDGLTWSTPQPLNVSGSPANETYGGALASGVTLKNGAHAGRMLVALRGDCCGQERTSFVIYSDDRGAKLARRPKDLASSRSTAAGGPGARSPSCRTARCC